MLNMKRVVALASLALSLVFSATWIASAKEIKGQDDMMAQMMKLGMPGEHHKALEAFIGKWNYTVTSWMMPKAAPMVMKGSSEAKWVFGGRFIEQDVTGGDSEHPFNGMGLIGYDNIQRQYNSIWIDSMSTGMMEGSSQYDSITQTFKESGTVACPMTHEKHRPYTSEIKIIDANHYTYTMYMRDPSSKKIFKSMEIDYVRAE